MKKVLTLIGARPQFVKAAVVSKAILDHGGLQELMVHSGQHYDINMSGIFFEQLNIPKPTHSLDVGSASHGAQTGEILKKFEDVLLAETPDCVLLYGDTNTTLAGALAAVKLHIPVAHIEAGLRSFNRRMPEEINRIVADSVSDMLFAPTPTAVRNLSNEGVPSAKVHLVGDVMQDAAMVFGQAVQSDTLLAGLGIPQPGYILVTIHRAENTDSPIALKAIVAALIELSATQHLVLPLHPRTRVCLEAAGLLVGLGEAIQLLEPQGYLAMLALEQSAALVLTDSGGVQKEAYFSSVPCVTVREQTEWVELVESGWNRLASPVDAQDIVTKAQQALGSSGAAVELYGGGRAANAICEVLAAQI